jgi:hypothetical protein
MSEKKKAAQYNLEQYNKIKEKRVKDRLKLQWPFLIKLFMALPLGYFAFLITYYLVYIRFTPEH